MGSSVTFTVTANGVGTLTYQWRKDGVTISGATNAAYIATAAGSYSVVVANSLGSVTSGSAVVTWRASALAGTYFGSFNSGGGFGTAASFTVGFSPAAVAVADVNAARRRFE